MDDERRTADEHAEEPLRREDLVRDEEERRAHPEADGDPTAHAVMIALREAATRLGRRSLAGTTIFTVVEPCPMCVGALLACDADGVVFALSDPNEGACLSAMRMADANGLGRRLNVVSGILQEDAAELRQDLERESLAT